MDNHELGPAAFRKGVAYHYHKETAIGDTTLITDWLLPFRGVADENFCHATAKIGIWFKRLSHDRYQEVLVLQWISSAIRRCSNLILVPAYMLLRCTLMMTH